MDPQDFLVQQNIMMDTSKREIKECQAHPGPKELVGHKVQVVPLEFLEVLDYQGLASEDPPDGQAWKGVKEREDLLEKMLWALLDPWDVLASQVHQAHQDFQDVQVTRFFNQVHLVTVDRQVIQDLQEFQELMDPKENQAVRAPSVTASQGPLESQDFQD